jgi:hypothetical protein
MNPRTLMLIASVLLAACGGAAPPERFYTLEPRAAHSTVSAETAFSVSVGPVSVPERVDRPQMVFRVSPQRVLIAEQSRWAEPLRHAIARVITGNLGRLLEDARVASHGQNIGADADVRVLVDVLSFESAPGKEASMEMAWSVKSGSGKRETSGRSVGREAIVSEDPEALVAAHEKLLLTASRDIATAIRAQRR